MALQFLNDGYFAGKVGIGVESPTRTLQVNSGGANIVATFESSDTLSRISFVDSNTSSDAVVQIGADGNELVLFAGGAEHVRVDSAGNVGIGTTTPDRKLHVKDSAIVVSEFEGTNTGSLLDLVNSNASQLYNGIRFTQGTSNKMAITHIADGTTKGYVQIGNSWATGSEILVVDGRTSNVGIGTTSPNALLDVSATSNATIRLSSSSANQQGQAIGKIDFYSADTSTPGAGVKSSITIMWKVNLVRRETLLQWLFQLLTVR